MNDFLFRGSLADLDPDVYELTKLEEERQFRKLILIPSESAAPLAVREALSSAFQNVYAEGYPDENTRMMSEGEITNYDVQLAHYRRYSDPRYYKGVEYADTIEALARRRCAETFASNGLTPDEIFVNVQPLSGAPANNAVYQALVKPGDTLMGMNLLHGGHLSHGSSVNRSGKLFNAIHYKVDPENEQLDYNQVSELAKQYKPKIIIAGYSSYPWQIDWKRFREISDSVGAFLFADIAHVAGLVAAGVFPSPVGYADVITFTTHKSLCGPRGACILTTKPSLSRMIDRAVFPGEQGGPHVNVFAAMAVAFRLAMTDHFRALQSKIVTNCVRLTQRLSENGFRIPYGGTNTHLMNLDCKSVRGEDGTPLSGDQAARILDLAGIIVNRNTIPGDESAANPSGIRMGTSWVTQRGFGEREIDHLAEIISEILHETKPYSLSDLKRSRQRSKIKFDVLNNARIQIRSLAENAGIDYVSSEHRYPHFYYLDDYEENTDRYVNFEIGGECVRSFLNFAVSDDIEDLSFDTQQTININTPSGEIQALLQVVSDYLFHITVPTKDAGLTATWLRDLSDGFVEFDKDILRKLPGPVWVKEIESITLDNHEIRIPIPDIEKVVNDKPYYVGISADEYSNEPLPIFMWEQQESDLRRTPIYSTHEALGAKLIPFAGWEMPVWYSSVVDEHRSVRQAAGLFDVSHMGVYQVEGPDAQVFLDSVVGNDIVGLGVGHSLYTHLLDPAANVIDDLLIYRRSFDRFLMVVNASNDDKDWAWLNAVKNGVVRVDHKRPWSRAFGRNVTLRNLRNPSESSDMRVDIALQGPKSRDILIAMVTDQETRRCIIQMKWAELAEVKVGDFDLVVSRTGYTGERMAFELFVHPDLADSLFRKILEVGEAYGLKPCGLGARDSLRTEAGLPLYGHEMGGEFNLGVGEAGFGSYVKTYKPWFIGRQSFIEQEKNRKSVVVRFRFNETGVRMAHLGDPIVDKRGRVIGKVTSCAIDSDGYLTGQALIDLKHSEEGTEILIFQSASMQAAKAAADLDIGDRTILPNPAVIISRFPKKR